MNHKYFTVEEANRSLVLVKKIVQDIIIKRKKMVQLKKTIRDLQESSNTKAKDGVFSLSNELKSISRSITYHLEELELVGCYLKDFELGIVDFPSIMRGRVVFLCWMYGEDEVNYFHELASGFETRKVLDTSFKTLTFAPLKRTSSNE